jgi:hypothetical protein
MGAARRHAQRDATADAGATAGDEDDLAAQDISGKNLHPESFYPHGCETPHATRITYTR